MPLSGKNAAWKEQTMDQQSAHDPPRLPLRIPVVVHGHTAGGTPTLRGGDSIVRPGDAAYDR